MTRYTATITHYSISRAPTVPVGDTLTAAKRNATKEFGDGFRDHTITITDTTFPAGSPQAEVASRKIGARKWHTQ